MKKNSKIQEISPVVTIFTLLLLCSGCYSARTISGSELPGYLEDYCEIHFEDTTYWLENTIIKGDYLYGSIAKYKGQQRTTFNKVYLSSDSLIIVNPENTIMFIPLRAISAAEAVTLTMKGSGGIFLGIALSALIILIVAFSRMPEI